MNYRMETGKWPLWPKDRNGEDIKEENPLIFGTPSGEYGLWMEDRLQNPREEYWRESGKMAYREASRRKILKRDYLEWLEEKITKIN